MEAWLEILGYAGIGLLCVGGLVLSCLSLSGTWLVVGATILGAWIDREGAPGLWMIGGYVAISLAIEGLEAMAGIWGVKRRGGSSLAGVMAFVGGIAGLVLGNLIPVPVVGPLVGMLAGSFLLVFIVERRRLNKTDPAVRIAMGTVVARVLVILLKMTATLGMTAGLIAALWR